jgi:hypothetical protein
MEDKREIKKVLGSQGDMHEKVANQSNSELLSSSPTRSPKPSHIQIDVQITYDIHFGCSTYPTKIRVIHNHQHNTDFYNRFGAAPLFWPDGPCIQLVSIRDAS